MIGIYMITNVENGRRYIGYSTAVNLRLSTHRSSLRKGNHINRLLQADFNKYGEGAFECSMIWVVDGEIYDTKEMVKAELAYIELLNPEYNSREASPAPLQFFPYGHPGDINQQRKPHKFFVQP